MDSTLLKRIKILAHTIQVILAQVLVFFVVLILLSVIDTVLAFFLNYDSGKSGTFLDARKFCTVFLMVIAIPSSVAAMINKPRLFRIISLIGMILMEFYIIYQCRFFGNILVLREFFILSFSLLVSCGISLPLFKKRSETRNGDKYLSV